MRVLGELGKYYRSEMCSCYFKKILNEASSYNSAPPKGPASTDLFSPNILTQFWHNINYFNEHIEASISSCLRRGKAFSYFLFLAVSINNLYVYRTLLTYALSCLLSILVKQ